MRSGIRDRPRRAKRYPDAAAPLLFSTKSDWNGAFVHGNLSWYAIAVKGLLEENRRGDWQKKRHSWIDFDFIFIVAKPLVIARKFPLIIAHCYMTF